MQTYKTSKARENILRKIRNGLKGHSLPMPFPEVDKDSLNQAFGTLQNFPEEDFAEAFIKLGGKFVYCQNEQELAVSLQALYDQRGWSQLLCADPLLMSRLKLSSLRPFDPSLETAEACITGCEALVARTGSAVLSSAQSGGRVAPVYFPVHIIVAYADQVVFDISNALELMTAKYGTNLPSLINLNTGPSRTADIEKTLVVGVHGPAEVFCFLIAE